MKEQEPKTLRDMGFRRDPFGLPVSMESKDSPKDTEKLSHLANEETREKEPIVVFESVPEPFAQWRDITQPFSPTIAVADKV